MINFFAAENNLGLILSEDHYTNNNALNSKGLQSVLGHRSIFICPP